MALVMISGLAGVPANGQQAAGGMPGTAAGTARSNAPFPNKPELMRWIAQYEDAERSAEQTHIDTNSLVKIYSNLAALYEDAAMYPRSEETIRRWVAALRGGPQDQLADAIGRMAVLHIAMGNPRQAEKDDLKALRIRESVGDPVGIALARSALADVYIKQRNFKKALNYAQKAMPVMADDPKVEVVDRILVRQTLAYAFCGLKQCGQAIPMLKDALEMEKSTYGSDSLMVGSGYFILGYASWHQGDMEDAANWMARGIARMKAELGWGHPIYLNAMSQYAWFLCECGQMEAAEAAEREVRMANAVVDVRTLAGRPSSSATAGLGGSR